MKKMLVLLLAINTTMLLSHQPEQSDLSKPSRSTTMKHVFRKAFALAECSLGALILFYEERLIHGEAGSMLKKRNGGMWTIYSVATGISAGLLFHGITGLKSHKEKTKK